MATKIRLRIKDQLTLNVKRAVILDEISISYKYESARFTWKEKYITQSDADIEDQSIINRSITTNISNDEKVTVDGTLITLDFIKSTRPIKVDETIEDYEIRMNKRLETELASGIGQFTYWINRIISPLEGVEMAKVFNNLGKFD